MIIAAMGADIGDEKDYSFVKEELKHIKDIPKSFDVELYKKLFVTDTVISYWKAIGYIPTYYNLFWLLQANRWDIYFDEYKKIYTGLVDKIYEENEKIGEAVREFYNLEMEGFEWFINTSKDYVYILSYSYDDGSGDNLICNRDYDSVIKRMRDEIESDDRDITFRIVRIPVIYSEIDKFEGIDIENVQGELTFDRYGKLIRIDDIRGLGFHPMNTMELTMPYIEMPHPFTKGDIISYKSNGETYYGVVSGINDETADELVARGVHLDGSDFVARIETVFKYDGELTLGHDHICPLYFDKYNEEIIYKKEDIFSSLGIMSDLIKGKTGCVSDLRYFMKGY